MGAQAKRTTDEPDPDSDRLRLPPGTMVDEYQIVSAIGAGGMAVVYAAISVLTGEKGTRERAIKFLLPREMQEGYFQVDYESTKQRFELEGEIGKELPYRGIVKAYGPVETVKMYNRPEPVDHLRQMDPEAARAPREQLPDITGLSYLVLERLRGETLDKRITRGCMPWGEAVQLVYEITEPLSFAHHQGICHRDLKPENIYLLAEPSWKDKDWCRFRILDWGIAKPKKRDKRLTVANVLIGTPNYVSPEQARGKEADQRSDIYALGTLLYYIIAGRFPVELPDTADPLALRAAIGEAKHRDIRQWGVEAPEALAEVLRKATHPDPDQRYQSATEFRDALSKLLSVPIMRTAWEVTHKEAASVEVALIASAVLPEPEPMLPVEKPKPKTLLLEMPEEEEEPPAAVPEQLPVERSTPHAQERRRRRPIAALALVVSVVLVVAVALAWRLADSDRSPASSPASIAPTPPVPAAPSIERPTPDTKEVNSLAVQSSKLSSDAVTDTPPITPAPKRDKQELPSLSAEQEKGTVTIRAYPYARVTVDGRYKGQTTLDLTLKPGSHTLVLEHPGLETQRRTIKIEPGRNPPIKVNWATMP